MPKLWAIFSFVPFPFFLGDHSYRLSCKVCNTANQSRIIAKKSISMKLYKVIKQPGKIIFSCWAFFASCKRNMLPGRIFCCDFVVKSTFNLLFTDMPSAESDFFSEIFSAFSCPSRLSAQSFFTMHFQESGQCFFHVLSFRNLINKSMFQQKF